MIAHAVADEHWHPQQQSLLLGDGSYELRIPYSDSRELVMDILKHGAKVEVIEPEELRREVLEHLCKAVAKYTEYIPSPASGRVRERVGERSYRALHNSLHRSP